MTNQELYELSNKASINDMLGHLERMGRREEEKDGRATMPNQRKSCSIEDLKADYLF